MQIGFVGLGYMGASMVERLLLGGHDVVVYNRSAAKTHGTMQRGARGAFSLGELCQHLLPPRAIWVMVPPGAATRSTLNELGQFLTPGDALVDGGSSRYEESMRLGEEFDAKGLEFLDVGLTGGAWERVHGCSLMVGGESHAVSRLAPVFTTLSSPNGWMHCGPVGTGHYAKMMHNAIERALLLAYAEGFALLQAGPFPLDLTALATLWNRGGGVRSRVLELTSRVLARDPDLVSVVGDVPETDDGRCMLDEAIERQVSTPVLAQALFARLGSRQSEAYAAKLVSALRQELRGDHPLAPGTDLPPP